MATPSTPADAPNSIITLLMNELRQSLEPKLLHALADYHLYKETHTAVLQIPFVKHLLENQCKCKSKDPANQPTHAQAFDPIQLEIIDVATEHALPNLDSIAEYINTTISDNQNEYDAPCQSGREEEEEEEEEEEDTETDEEEDAEAEDEDAEAEDEEDAEAEDEEDAEADEEEVLEDEDAEAKDEDADEEDEEAEDEEDAEAEAKDEDAEAEDEEDAEAEDEDEDAEAEVEEEEELELFEVEIKGKTYVTNDETDGDIYAYVNEEVGEIVGTFKNGVAKFAKKSKSKST